MVSVCDVVVVGMGNVAFCLEVLAVLHNTVSVAFQRMNLRLIVLLLISSRLFCDLTYDVSHCYKASLKLLCC